MSAKILSFVLILSVCRSALGDNLEEVKKAAVKNIDAQLDFARKEYTKSFHGFTSKMENLNNLGKNKMKYGEFILNATCYEVNHVVRSATDKAAILSSPKEVRQCVDALGRSAQADVREVYSLKFVPTGEAIAARGKSVCEEEHSKWIKAEGPAWDTYATHACPAAKNEVQRATSEAQVAYVVAAFQKLTEHFVESQTTLLPEVTKVQARFENLLHGHLLEWRATARKMLDETVRDVQTCFGTFLKHLTRSSS